MKNSLGRANHLRTGLSNLLVFCLGLVLTAGLWTVNIPTAQATGVYSMPNLKAGDSTWVLDQAGVFSRLTQGELAAKLENLAKTTGTKLAW